MSQCNDCDPCNGFSSESGLGGGKKVNVIGDGNEITVERFEGLDEVTFKVMKQAYIPPALSIPFVPASLEKGTIINREALVIELNANKGRDVITKLTVPALGLDISSPAVPFSQQYAFPGSGPLGDTESPSISGTADDGKQHSFSSSLVRTDRVFFGVIATNPREASVQQLMNAALDMEGGIPGRLLTSMPSTITFPVNGGYWFIFVPDNNQWKFGMKYSGLTLIPMEGVPVSVRANPNTNFLQNYKVYCNATTNAGTLTYNIVK